jgi:hypothetical protein
VPVVTLLSRAVATAARGEGWQWLWRVACARAVARAEEQEAATVEAKMWTGAEHMVRTPDFRVWPQNTAPPAHCHGISPRSGNTRKLLLLSAQTWQSVRGQRGPHPGRCPATSHKWRNRGGQPQWQAARLSDTVFKSCRGCSYVSAAMQIISKNRDTIFSKEM